MLSKFTSRKKTLKITFSGTTILSPQELLPSKFIEVSKGITRLYRDLQRRNYKEELRELKSLDGGVWKKCKQRLIGKKPLRLLCT